MTGPQSPTYILQEVGTLPRRLPGSPQARGLRESGGYRGPHNWGLSSPDANLHPGLEKVKGHQAKGSPGRVRGLVCLSNLTAVLGFSGCASQRERPLECWSTGPGGTEPGPGSSNIPIPHHHWIPALSSSCAFTQVTLVTRQWRPLPSLFPKGGN